MTKRFLLALALLLFARTADATICTAPYTFVNGTTADGGQVSSNFTSVLGCINSFGSAGLEISGGDLILDGANSGKVTIHPQANAGTWNFNLPTIAGISGLPLVSGGGGLAPMTWSVLGVSGGGTGLLAGVSGGIPAFTGTTTLTSSALMTQHALMIGGGAGAVPYPLASLGTATTVLHGAAAGDPSFGAIANADLANASLTIGTTNVALGATSLTLAGLTSVNKVLITAPATSATLTLADGKALTVNNSLIFTGTDGITVGFGGGLTIAAGKVLTASNTMTFAGTDAQTYTMPTASDTMVGRASTDTMSNKTFVAPVLGAATATSINGLTLTASTGTFTLTNGKTFSVGNTITLSGTDAQTYTFPTSSKTLLANDFSNVGSTKLGLANGGTNTDLSVTGGANQVLAQNSTGAAITVRQLACADLSDAASNCSSGSSFKAVIAGSTAGTNLNNAATNYVGFTVSATEGSVYIPVPYNATVTSLTVVGSALIGGGTSYAFTVRKGSPALGPSTDTSLTCTITVASVLCSDLSDSFTVTAGQVLTLKSVPTGAPTAIAITGWSVELDPT